MKATRSTEAQRQAFLEGLYSNYTELQHQSEEVQERKRRIDYETYDSNAKEIHNLLFSESDAAEKDLGDRATYDRVQSILKKVVYGRSHQQMGADKGLDALHVRVATLETTVCSQNEVIRQLKANLAASEEELCGLLRQLSAKDSDIRVLTSKVNRHFMQLRVLERECAALRNDLASSCSENVRLNALLFNAETILTEGPPLSVKVLLDGDNSSPQAVICKPLRKASVSSSSFKAARRKSSLRGRKRTASVGPIGSQAPVDTSDPIPNISTNPTTTTMTSVTATLAAASVTATRANEWGNNDNTQQVRSEAGLDRGVAASTGSTCPTTDSDAAELGSSSVVRIEKALQNNEIRAPDSVTQISQEQTAFRSGTAVLGQTANSSAQRDFVEFQTDLELLVGANRRLEKENADMRQQLQAMMLDEELPALHLEEMEGAQKTEDEKAALSVLDEEHVAVAKAAVVTNMTADKMMDHDTRIGYILAHAPQSAALMNLQFKMRKCTALLEMEAATTLYFLDFDAASVGRLDVGQQNNSESYANDAGGASHQPVSRGEAVHDAGESATLAPDRPGSRVSRVSTETDAERSKTATAATTHSSCEVSYTSPGAVSKNGKAQSDFSTEEDPCAQAASQTRPESVPFHGTTKQDIARTSETGTDKEVPGQQTEHQDTEAGVHTAGMSSLLSTHSKLSVQGTHNAEGLPTLPSSRAASTSMEDSYTFGAHRKGAEKTVTSPSVPVNKDDTNVTPERRETTHMEHASGNAHADGRLPLLDAPSATAPTAGVTGLRGDSITADVGGSVSSSSAVLHRTLCTDFSPDKVTGRLGDLKRDLFGVDRLFRTLHEEVCAFLAQLGHLLASLAAANNQQATEVQTLMDDIIKEATVSMAKENVLQSFKNKYNIDIEQKELDPNMSDEEWLAQNLKNIAVEMVEKKIQHFSSPSKCDANGHDKGRGTPPLTTGSRHPQGRGEEGGGRFTLGAGKKTASAHSTPGVGKWQDNATELRKPLGSVDAASDARKDNGTAGEGAGRVPRGTTCSTATTAPKKSAGPQAPFNFGDNMLDLGMGVGGGEEEDECLRFPGQRFAPTSERAPFQRNPLRWYPIPNFDTDTAALARQPVFRGPSGGGARGHLDVLELLRRMQPEDNGSVEDMRPTVYRYLIPSAYDAARQYAKNRLQHGSRFIRSPQFDLAVKEDILPIAQKADDIARGKCPVDAPLHKAVRELRLEDAKRRKQNAEMLFRRVATNIKMRRLLKQQVYNGNAFYSYISLLYNRWAANQTQEIRRRAFEKTQLSRHLLDACGLGPHQPGGNQGSRTVSSAARQTQQQATALPPLRGSHMGGHMRPYSYQKGSSFHFKDVNFADDRSK